MRNSYHKRLDVLRKRYPKGCLVELVQMDDNQAPPIGTLGRVLFVDDIGTIHVSWSNGSTLGVVPEADLITIRA